MTRLRKYQRLMEYFPLASYFLAIMGLGMPMLHLYLWIAKLGEKSK